jgi:hypothetical protein
VVAGAQTDLSTARDTSVMALREATAKPRSPLIYGLPLIAIAAIGGVLGVVGLKGKGAGKDPSGSQPPPSGIVAVPAETPVTNITPPPSATPSADTSAKLAAVPSASASVARTGPHAPPVVPIVKPPTPGERALGHELNQ